MNLEIQFRGRQSTATESFRNAAEYQAAVTILLSQHVERGHVIEQEHGRVAVRDRHGERVADYWFVD